jgi:CO dehydrogenase nickel-insertion accessory protein CooC1
VVASLENDDDDKVVVDYDNDISFYYRKVEKVLDFIVTLQKKF